jgi:4-hydroxybenzoate polyprenyltransferase
MQDMQESAPQPRSDATAAAVEPRSKPSVLTFVRLLRPRQWVKNLIAYAPALFGSQLFAPGVFMKATICVLAFCLISSAVYVLNDILDRDNDRLHPKKRNRPIASGAIPISLASGIAIALTIGAFVLAAFDGPQFLMVIAGYLAMMIGYCTVLKQIVLLDVLVIAAGFVLRALGGAVACQIEPSPWFLLCTIFGALFLAIEKRSHEARLLDATASAHRKSLSMYPRELLDKLQSLATSSLIISYALYTFHSPHGQMMMITVPIVLFAVMRYQLLSVSGDLTGTPEEALLKDTSLKVSVILWVLTCGIVVYHKSIAGLNLFG